MHAQECVASTEVAGPASVTHVHVVPRAVHLQLQNGLGRWRARFQAWRLGPRGAVLGYAINFACALAMV